MFKLKEWFSTPKKAALAIACIGVIVVTLGICIVVYAAGPQGAERSSAIGGDAAQNYAFADAGVDPALAQAVKVKYERFQGNFAYEVEFVAGDTEYEYKIGAEDGSVLKKEAKTVKGPGNSLPAAASVTLEEAREIALADAGLTRDQATFTEAKSDMEGGFPVHELEFYSGNMAYDYEINAATGAIYSKKTTTYVTQGGGSPSAQPTQASTRPPATPAPTQTPTQAPATPAPTQAPTQAPATPAPTQAPQPTQQGGGLFIGIDAAKSAALANAGVSAEEARFTKARMDYEDGVPVYEVEFCTATHEYEYEIHAHTGAVCHKSVESCSGFGSHHGSSGHHSAGGSASGADVGAEAAKSAALSYLGSAAGDVMFTKVERDYDDGRLVYEIELYQNGSQYEFKIDGASGTVLEFEQE